MLQSHAEHRGDGFGNLWTPGKHAPTDRFLPKDCAAVAVEMRTLGDAIHDKISPGLGLPTRCPARW